MENIELLAQLIRASASDDVVEAAKARALLFKAMAEPIKKGVMEGPGLYTKIFSQLNTGGETSVRYTAHFLQPGMESEYVAYTVPECGTIPYRTVHSNDIYVQTYSVANSIDACQDYIQRARMDVVSELMQVYQDGFIQKLNRDGNNALMAAAVGRNIVVQDTAADPGVFTFDLVSKAKTKMARAGGGNQTSVNGYRLTDALISLEAMEALRNVSVDELTLRRGEMAQDEGVIMNLFGVNFHEVFELGQNQRLNDFAVKIGHNFSDDDVELALGLDLTPRNKRNYVMPVSSPLVTREDPLLDRMGRWGVYGRMGVGFGVLDDRNVILLSY